MDSTKPVILLVEDNAGDAHLVSEALREIQADIKLIVAEDGRRGLDVLQAMAARGRPPGLIILNFNLPKLSGPQLLAAIRLDGTLARVPIIMLTSSDRDSDRAACAGVNDYLIKSSVWEDTLGIARRIVELLHLPGPLPAPAAE